MRRYIDAEKLKAEIERRKELLENGTGHPEVMKRVEGVLKGYNSILDFIALQQEQLSLPDNLDEAAEEQTQSFGYQKEDYEYKELIETFKAGAEWMAEQGVTVDGYITDEIAYSGVAVILDNEGEFKPKEEVIVQIRKK